MYKLNIHSHTEYSDGHQSIAEYAEIVRDLGYSCLVTSDHDYMLIDPNIYLKQIEESKAISKKMKFPIINCMEIQIRYEEAVLVNQKMCLDWLKNRLEIRQPMLQLNDYTKFNNWLKSFSEDYVLSLNHPTMNDDPSSYVNYTHYEVANHGNYCWYKKFLYSLKKRMPNAKMNAGVDAHGSWMYQDLTYECSHLITKKKVKNEKDLIDILLKGDYEINGIKKKGAL